MSDSDFVTVVSKKKKTTKKPVETWNRDEDRTEQSRPSFSSSSSSSSYSSSSGYYGDRDRYRNRYDDNKSNGYHKPYSTNSRSKFDSRPTDLNNPARCFGNKIINSMTFDPLASCIRLIKSNLKKEPDNLFFKKLENYESEIDLIYESRKVNDLSINRIAAIFIERALARYNSTAPNKKVFLNLVYEIYEKYKPSSDEFKLTIFHPIDCISWNKNINKIEFEQIVQYFFSNNFLFLSNNQKDEDRLDSLLEAYNTNFITKEQFIERGHIIINNMPINEINRYSKKIINKMTHRKDFNIYILTYCYIRDPTEFIKVFTEQLILNNPASSCIDFNNHIRNYIKNLDIINVIIDNKFQFNINDENQKNKDKYLVFYQYLKSIQFYDNPNIIKDFTNYFKTSIIDNPSTYEREQIHTEKIIYAQIAGELTFYDEYECFISIFNSDKYDFMEKIRMILHSDISTEIIQKYTKEFVNLGLQSDIKQFKISVYNVIDEFEKKGYSLNINYKDINADKTINSNVKTIVQTNNDDWSNSENDADTIANNFIDSILNFYSNETINDLIEELNDIESEDTKSEVFSIISSFNIDKKDDHIQEFIDKISQLFF